MVNEYIGDGVYMQIDDEWSVTLTTGSHDPACADAVIILESGVLNAMLEVLNRDTGR